MHDASQQIAVFIFLCRSNPPTAIIRRIEARRLHFEGPEDSSRGKGVQGLALDAFYDLAEQDEINVAVSENQSRRTLRYCGAGEVDACFRA